MSRVSDVAQQPTAPTLAEENPDNLVIPDVHADSDPLTKQEERAWYVYDWSNSAYVTTIISAFLPTFFATLYGPSFFAFWVSASVICQIAFFSLIGGMADWGDLRKTLWIVFSTIGAIGSCLFVLGTLDIRVVDPVIGNLPWTATNTTSLGYIVTTGDGTKMALALLMVVTNFCYGASFVFYNAYLPLLVRAKPEIRALRGVERETLLSMETDLMSNKGVIAGFVGGFVLTCINVGISFGISAPETATLAEVKTIDAISSGLNCMVAGLWWLLFSLYSFKHVKRRPGPKLPDGETYVSVNLKRSAAAVRHLKSLPNCSRLLVAFFFYSDGAATIGSVGVLFGSIEIGMQAWEVGIILLEVQVMGLAGNAFFLLLQQKRGATSKTIVCACLAGLGILPVYGSLGLIPGSPLGIKTRAEFYAFGALYGFFQGALQSYSRSLFSDMIPRSLEGLFFSVYEITDKGSSWIGPLAVGIILESTKSVTHPNGNMRVGFLLLTLFLCAPLPFLYWGVDVPTARLEARAFERSLHRHASIKGWATVAQDAASQQAETERRQRAKKKQANGGEGSASGGAEVELPTTNAPGSAAVVPDVRGATPTAQQPASKEDEGEGAADGEQKEAPPTTTAAAAAAAAGEEGTVGSS